MAHSFASRLLRLPLSLHSNSMDKLQLNEDIVALSLPLLFSLPLGKDAEELLLLERYFDDTLCTDTIRTAACSALCQHLCSPSATPLLSPPTTITFPATKSPIILMIERCLWDDCSAVRTQMATCLARLLSPSQFNTNVASIPAAGMDDAESTSWSIQRAMFHFYRTFRAHFPIDQHHSDGYRYAADKELFGDEDCAEEEKARTSMATLFEAEPRNAFVDIGWRHLLLERTLPSQVSSTLACQIDALHLN